MDFILQFINDYILHLDQTLVTLVATYQWWTYAILFVVIFCETGLVVTPFLPGDSLLFAAGALAAVASVPGQENPLHPALLFGVIALAAILGDTANYGFGRYLGMKVFGRFINPKHLKRTHEFYERHGGKTIIIARFVPIVRTLAPFVAGIGQMTYVHFIMFNVVGGLTWPLLFILGGYFFADAPVVKHNFTLVIFAIIILSVMPAVIEFARQKWFAKKEPIG